MQNNFSTLLKDIKIRIQDAQTRAIPQDLKSSLPTIEEIELELSDKIKQM